MSTGKAAINNSFVVLFGMCLNTVTAFAMTFLLARYLGKQGYGNYALALALLSFFVMIEETWLKPVIIREATRADAERKRELFGNFVILNALFSLIADACILMIIAISQRELETTRLLYLVLILLPVMSISSAYEVIFRVFLKMKYYVFSLVSGNILLIVMAICFIALKKPAYYFLSAMVVANVLTLLLNMRLSRKLTVPKLQLKKESCRVILSHSWPLALTAFFIAVYQRIDQIMLFQLKGSGAVGLYATAAKITESFNVLPLALGISLLPLMSHFFYTDKERFKKAYQMSFKYLSIFIFPVATAIAFFSKDLILFVYGDEFIASSAVLGIFIWSEVFVYFGIINKQILTASDNQALDPLFTGVSAFVNIVLNICLIPRFDITGAAFAHLIAVAVGPCMGLFLKRTNEYSRCMFAYSLKPLIGCCAGWLVIALCHLNWVSSISLFSALYLAILYAFRFIDKSEVQIFKTMMGQRIV